MIEMNIGIKICEDNEIQLKYIKESLNSMLNNINYTVECFTSAKDLLNSNLEDTNLFILDLDLGDDWGMEVAEKIRKTLINTVGICLYDDVTEPCLSNKSQIFQSGGESL